MNRKILFFVLLAVALFACEDLINPALENNRSLVDAEPRFAQGLLINGYARIPTSGWTFSEMATDDAVASDETNTFATIATGAWAANTNPLDQWTNSKSAIQYLNLMLKEVDSVKYSETPAVNQMFKNRLRGESYGLRALFMYYLLQAHGGIAGNQLLGIPIVLQPEDLKSDFNKPRASFEECMQQLYQDAAAAINLLPMDYADINNASLIPQQYLDLQANINDYNRVFGNNARSLVSGRIVRAVKSQAALLAASPAFGNSNTTTWADAANFAAEIIDANGGVSGLALDGATWFSNIAQINAIGGGVNPPEILWRTDIGSSNSLESQNYPPTLLGKGLVNPTQNLVDAFPTVNGYPITHPASGYNPTNPYANRDPRLQQTIVVNGSTLGPNNTTINTAADGDTKDGLNKVGVSTRTGYYLRKLLRQDVNLNSGNSQFHVKPRIRYTEIYLIYAEGANEAWGPLGTGSHSYSAYDVIKLIRKRAGVGLTNSDAYLESIKNDKAAMRTLIRNERRLELSFEGFRFWDLRRWNMSLIETAQGVRIAGGTQQIIDVENRLYSDHMIYGPIPYTEILKFGALQQNNGW